MYLTWDHLPRWRLRKMHEPADRPLITAATFARAAAWSRKHGEPTRAVGDVVPWSTGAKVPHPRRSRRG